MLQDWHLDPATLLAEVRSREFSKPTNSSIRLINESLNITLPESLIQFATQCPSYGEWITLIDGDIENHENIVTTNRFFHETGADGAIPDWLIMINSGHDDNCYGFDTRHQNTKSGEYPVIYYREVL